MPLPPHLVKDPPQLGVDLPDLLDMRPGPSAVRRVRGCYPRLALRGPRSRAFAAVQLASGFLLERRFLATVTPTGFCPASCSRPGGPEPGLKPRLNQRPEVSFG